MLSTLLWDIFSILSSSCCTTTCWFFRTPKSLSSSMIYRHCCSTSYHDALSQMLRFWFLVIPVWYFCLPSLVILCNKMSSYCSQVVILNESFSYERCGPSNDHTQDPSCKNKVNDMHCSIVPVDPSLVPRPHPLMRKGVWWPLSDCLVVLSQQNAISHVTCVVHERWGRGLGMRLQIGQLVEHMVAWRSSISLGCSVSRLLTRHNQEIAQWSPDPFPRERVGSGHETTNRSVGRAHGCMM